MQLLCIPEPAPSSFVAMLKFTCTTCTSCHHDHRRVKRVGACLLAQSQPFVSVDLEAVPPTRRSSTLKLLLGRGRLQLPAASKRGSLP